MIPIENFFFQDAIKGRGLRAFIKGNVSGGALACKGGSPPLAGHTILLRETLVFQVRGRATRQSKALVLAVILRRLRASMSKNSRQEIHRRPDNYS